MTREQIVKVLADKGGWSPCNCGNANCFRHLEHGNKFLHDIGYLTSIDALRPVLAKLSPLEWCHLVKILDKNNAGHVMSIVHQQIQQTIRWTLELPPEKLAEAIAEAIVKAKGVQ